MPNRTKSAREVSAELGIVDSSRGLFSNLVDLKSDKEIFPKTDDFSRTIKKYLVTLLCAFALICTFIAIVPSVEGNVKEPELESWINYAADNFAGGNGTEDDPYQIATPEQLAYLAKIVNAGKKFNGNFFTLTEDIDLGGRDWTPIGVSDDLVFHDPGMMRAFKPSHPEEETSVAFSGHFDGNGRTIYNLAVHQFWGHSGLFGFLSGGSVKNLELKSVDIRAGYESGGIAGHINTHSSGQISNCFVEGKIAGYRYVGGIAGVAYLIAINDCITSVDIISTRDVNSEYVTANEYFRSQDFYVGKIDFYRQISNLFSSVPVSAIDFYSYDEGIGGAMIGYGLINESALNCNSRVVFKGPFFAVGSILGSSSSSLIVEFFSCVNCSVEWEIQDCNPVLYNFPFF